MGGPRRHSGWYRRRFRAYPAWGYWFFIATIFYGGIALAILYNPLLIAIALTVPPVLLLIDTSIAGKE